MPFAEMDKTEFKLSLIARHAREDKEFQFTSLAHLLNADFLKRCFASLNRNKAVGQDNVSWYDYDQKLDANITDLVARLKRKSFRPVPARRVYIPKGKDNFRPLGISAIENKIVERGITEILQAVFEQDFSGQSFGFRPGRNCHHALKEVNDLIMFKPVNHIVEADIKGFFDNVSHEHLLDFLSIRIKDSSLLCLIGRFLKAGYVEDGALVRTEEGTPQGSILSPMLANVFLHYVLDDWFEKVAKQHTQGYCELIRYADDFVCVVQKAEDAKRIEVAIGKRFERFGLEINPEKSRRFSFGKYEAENACNQSRRPNTFDFLGFTHFCDRTLRGGFKLGRKTSKKKYSAKLREINLWLKGIRNLLGIKDWWKILVSKLRGHIYYYGVSGNYRSVNNFRWRVRELTFKWLNRRSQKRSMNWREFNRYLKRNPLPKPEIKHNLYLRVHEVVR